MGDHTSVPFACGPAGGFPAPSAFPITQLSFKTVDGTEVSIDDPAKVTGLQLFCVSEMTDDWSKTGPHLRLGWRLEAE